MKKSVITGSLIFLVGCLMFTITMCTLKWDFTKLSNRSPYEEKTTVIENTNQSLSLDCNDVEISVDKSSDNNIHFIYYERENEHYDFAKGNTVIVKKVSNYKWYEYLSIFDFYPQKPFTILLPENFDGNLNLSTRNSKIQIDNVSMRNIKAKTSDAKVNSQNVKVKDDMLLETSNDSVELNEIKGNGKIEINNRNGSVNINNISSKSIIVESSNEKILAKDIIMINDIQLKTSNGKIDFDSISANKSINLETDNDKIVGSLCGKMSDYNITSKTSNAKNSLPEKMPDGHTLLNVFTSNADIDVTFGN